MSVAARRLAEAGVRAELGRNATDAEVFRAVFLRFYERELGRERALRIVEAIEARRARGHFGAGGRPGAARS